MKLGNVDDATCRFCNEDDEETWHVIAECPCFAVARSGFFEEGRGKYPTDCLRLPDYCKVTTGSLLHPPGT